MIVRHMLQLDQAIMLDTTAPTGFRVWFALHHRLAIGYVSKKFHDLAVDVLYKDNIFEVDGFGLRGFAHEVVNSHG